MLFGEEIPFLSQEVRIYEIRNNGTPEFTYRAISLKSKQTHHKTEISYVYQDLEWILEAKKPDAIFFPRLTIPVYKSTQPRLAAVPNKDDPAPEFRNVEEGSGALEVSLNCPHGIARLIYALTGWELTFHVRASKITLTTGGLLNFKETHRKVSVQLWEKPDESEERLVQLAMRIDDESDNRWITATLDDCGHSIEDGPMTLNLELNGLDIQRGYEMDTYQMIATKHEEQEDRPSRKRWKVVIQFQEVDHRKGFINSLPPFVR